MAGVFDVSGVTVVLETTGVLRIWSGGLGCDSAGVGSSTDSTGGECLGFPNCCQAVFVCCFAGFGHAGTATGFVGACVLFTFCDDFMLKVAEEVVERVITLWDQVD